MRLNVLDNKLKRLAQTLNGSLTKDIDKRMVPGYEGRSVSWVNDELNKLIQIYPEIKNESIHKWIFWACCSYDIDNNRYWKNKALMQSRDLDKIVAEFDKLCSEAIDFLNGLTKDDLEIVVRLKQL